MSETITKAYFGFVEDVNDPDMRGRVRVRIAVLDEDKEREDLPWAFPLNPIQSSSLYLDKAGGVGISPTGILPGSQVFVLLFFTPEIPTSDIRLVLGTIPKISTQGLHDVSNLARGTNSIAKNLLKSEVQDKQFEEPKSTYNAKYPNNKVITTPRGHAIEIDDTSGAERIHIYHASGTYTEISFDGTRVTKVMGNDTSITMSDKTIYVEGNATVMAKGKIEILSDKKIKLKAPEISLNDWEVD